MLPDVDGVEVLRRLRSENKRLPVLMLTARDALEHRIDGLSAGADDYVTKPFSLEEVMLRLRGLLRRAGPAETPDQGLGTSASPTPPSAAGAGGRAGRALRRIGGSSTSAGSRPARWRRVAPTGRSSPPRW
jgi:DNA-binding response OmpR family regulator